MASRKRSIPDRISRGAAPVAERLQALNKTQRHAVLATVSNGRPYASLVAFALTDDGTGIVFATPKASTKYKNIVKNKHVSLLIDTRSNASRDYLGAESITILGIAGPVTGTTPRRELAQVLTKKHPALAAFIRSPKTALIHVEAAVCMHVSRFQTVSVWTVK